jgi:hypothetical protein
LSHGRTPDARTQRLARPARSSQATLWCLAVLLAVLLLAYWGMREIYST